MINPEEYDGRRHELDKRNEVVAEIHNYHSRAHDGGAALYLPSTNSIVALGAERVDRHKHSSDSAIAYNYLKSRLTGQKHIFGGTKDKFESSYNRDQEIYHHLCHAAGAYYPSGFIDAGVLIVDDRGYYKDGYNSTSIWSGTNTKELDLLETNLEHIFPSQSIGHLYSGITDYLGFGFLEAGKTMGLAAYGKESDAVNWLNGFVEINPDGSYQIEQTFSQALRYLYRDEAPPNLDSLDPRMIETMEKIQGFLGSRRQKSEPLTQRDMDVAWAIQDLLERLMLGLAKRTKELTGSQNLCLAGGVALNSVANGKIVKSGLFDQVYIQPASGDDGQALGKLLYRLYHEYGVGHIPDLATAYLGPEYTEAEIVTALEKFQDQIVFSKKETEELLTTTAQALANQRIVAWHQGRSEMGPRALGHRSILADPRPEGMRDYINFRVKNREWFRPLAPSVLWEKAHEYFDIQSPSPYMLVVSDVWPEKRDVIPAVTHVDGTARVQTVTAEENGIYYRLIQAFEKETGIPLVLNTSFNVAGEPIVETPEDAVRSFLSTNLDLLVIGNYIVEKKANLVEPVSFIQPEKIVLASTSHRKLTLLKNAVATTLPVVLIESTEEKVLDPLQAAKSKVRSAQSKLGSQSNSLIVATDVLTDIFTYDIANQQYALEKRGKPRSLAELQHNFMQMLQVSKLIGRPVPYVVRSATVVLDTASQREVSTEHGVTIWLTLEGLEVLSTEPGILQYRQENQALYDRDVLNNAAGFSLPFFIEKGYVAGINGERLTDISDLESTLHQATDIVYGTPDLELIQQILGTHS